MSLNEIVEFDVADVMTVAMSRLVRNGEISFVGVNSPLPFVAVSLARRTHAPRTRFLTVAGGLDVRPLRPVANTSSSELSVGTAAIFDNQEIYALNGRGKIDLTFLGMAQIDELGQVNSSYIGDPHKPTVRFPGGGGAPAIMPMAKRVVLWRCDHTRKIFTDRVDFVTSTGNLHRVISSKCVFAFEHGKLCLESIHPGVSREDLADNTGFDLHGLDSAPITRTPSATELAVLGEFDPRNVRGIEFPQRAKLASTARAES
jgi:glutaconate CoA-transferase subunit B